jgi:hypothetical protein
MTDTKQAVRMIKDFAHFPPGAMVTMTWHRGDVIESPEVIELLISLNAPIERIEIEKETKA